MDQDAQQLKDQLDALRRSLKAPYEVAKAAGDEAEMERLKGIALEIDEQLRRLALGMLGDLAQNAESISAKIEKRTLEVKDFSTVTLDEVKEKLKRLLDRSAEETLVVAATVAPAEPVVDSAPRAEAPQVLGTGQFVITEAHLIALWRRSAFPINDGKITVFGLRGCRPVDFSGTGFSDALEITPSSVDYQKMNCTIGQWHPGKGFALFPGSTVPYGKIVQNKIAANGVGVNQMGRGRYKKYRAGWHKRSEGANGHWALQQDSPITIQRTGDDADYDLSDRWEVGRIAGDNIHCAFHMGLDGNPADAGFSSAGCQTIAGTLKKGQRGSEVGPWKKFIEPFGDEIDKQSATEYVLFAADEMQLMIRTQCVGKSVLLRIGSVGPLVKKLQAALNIHHDADLKIDGDFGPGTFLAVTEYQTIHFGPEADDGIVGGATAEALGFELPDFDFDDAINGGLGYSDPSGNTEPPVGQGGTDVASGDATGQSNGSVEASEHGDPIAFGNVTRDLHGQAFNDKVIEISGRLQCDPNHLMAIMAFETGESFAPDKKNTKSGATGLIQFIPKTAKNLGTTVTKLSKMQAIEQLDFVEAHFKSITSRPLISVSDAYMAVLWPAAIGKPDSHVLFKEGSKAYAQNAGLDKNKNGRITKAEAAGKVSDKLILGMKQNRFG